jgi:hypothetical protein
MELAVVLDRVGKPACALAGGKDSPTTLRGEAQGGAGRFDVAPCRC